jgi:probable F420-dependent oxidoreductase
MVFSGVLVSGSSVGQHVQVAKEAEACGYETGIVTEVSAADAVTVLAASAAATTRLKLATGITPVYARDPYLMAMTVASLQDLSEGRFTLGLGTSTPAIMTGWHGLPFERPLATMRAHIELVRKFLAGERVKSDGVYKITGASLKAARFPTKIFVAALNPGMLELAGEVADGVILNFPTPQYAARAVEIVLGGLKKSGRSREEFEIWTTLRTGITDGGADITAAVRRELLSYCLTPVYQKVFSDDGYGAQVAEVARRWKEGDRTGAPEAIDDVMAGAHAAIGTVDECRAQVQRIKDQGIDKAFLFPVVAEGGFQRYLETIRAFAPGM